MNDKFSHLDDIGMPAVFFDGVVKGVNDVTLPFKYLKKIFTIKQQDTCNVVFPIKRYRV